VHYVISLHDGQKLVTLYGTSCEMALKTQQSSMNDYKSAAKKKINFTGTTTTEQRSLKFRPYGSYLNSCLLFSLK